MVDEVTHQYIVQQMQIFDAFPQRVREKIADCPIGFDLRSLWDIWNVILFRVGVGPHAEQAMVKTLDAVINQTLAERQSKGMQNAQNPNPR